MDSKRRFYTAACIVCLASFWHSTVGSENCNDVIGGEQPHCVSITTLPETGVPSEYVIFSLYREVIGQLQEARFNFNDSTFTRFYNCLVQAKNINCTVFFKRMENPSSFNYTANRIEAENSNMLKNGAQNFADYWTCSVPVHPQLEFFTSITCRRRIAESLIPQCNMSGICSSIGIIQNKSKNLVKMIWTLRSPGVPIDDCEMRPLEIQYISNIVTVIPCSADDGKCNSSTNAEDCGDRPASTDQSEESAPTALIIGIVCVIVIIIVLAVLGAYFLRQKVRNKQRSTTSKISGTSPNLAAVPSTLDTDKNDNGAFPSKDAGSNMPSNIPKNNHGLALAYDSLTSTSTTRDSVTLNGYATIADTEDSSGNPSDSNDKRVGNHNDTSAETSQYSSVDCADAAGSGYSKLGEQIRNFKNPYNVLLKPKEDPRARNPVPIPDESTKQPSRYSLAHPILDSGSSRPIEVVDIVHPVHNPDKTSEKGDAKPSQKKSTNDYDYPSDEEMPVKRKDPTYFELEKEEDIAETNTTGGDTYRPYFELEKVEESDTDYGAAYSNQGFDPQE